MKRYQKELRTALACILILCFAVSPVSAFRYSAAEEPAVAGELSDADAPVPEPAAEQEPAPEPAGEQEAAEPSPEPAAEQEAAEPSSEPAGEQEAADPDPESDEEQEDPEVFRPHADVSAMVEQYSKTIRKCAAKYSIPEYAELIKAIMMQESKGAGKDPMQSSESAYNTQYPQKPNGIKDPAYSIEVGAHSLSMVLRLAGTKGPDDYEGIALALQGYNYGMGYISWALEKYGGYSKLNAVEYSEQMCKNMKWAGFGDRNYVAHVLRYYRFSKVRDDPNLLIVEIARDELGKADWTAATEKKRFRYPKETSAMFVYRCAERVGCFVFASMPDVGSAKKAEEWYKARKKWRDADYFPLPGDILFLDGDGDGVADHMAIVEWAEAGVIHTVEADPATSVCVLNQYEIGSAPISGYGNPSY